MATTQRGDDASIRKTIAATAPGVILALAIGSAAAAAGKAAPLVGSAIPALAGGFAASAALGRLRAREPGSPAPRAIFLPGTRFSGKTVLQAGVALLGSGLMLSKVASVGLQSAGVMLSSLCAAALATALGARLLRVPAKTAALIGVGTGICGGSAIAAAAPAIGAEDRDISYSFSVIFLFNLVALFVFPLLGRLFGLDDRAFGIWAGTAINDTSSVVAAAYGWSMPAGDLAVVVKLARTLMIVPITLVLGYAFSRGSGTAGRARRGASIPWFIPAFVAMSLLSSLGVLPPAAATLLNRAGRFAIPVALAGIGFGTDTAAIAKAGWRPLALGCFVWAAVAGSSLLAQALTGVL